MNKLYIENVEFTNFKIHDEFSLNLDDLTLIEGRNGSGKSSIFEAIYVALYNRRPNGKPAKTAIKRGTNLSTITLTFYYNNDQYKLIRTIGSKNNVSLYMNDDLVTTSSTKVKEIIESMIPPEIFKLTMLEDVDIKKLLIKYIASFDHIDKLNNYKNIIESELEEQKNLQIELDSKLNVLVEDINKLYHSLNTLYQEIQDNTRELETIQVPDNIDDLIAIQNLINKFDHESYAIKLLDNEQKELDQIENDLKTFIEKKDLLLRELEYKKNEIENNIQNKYSGQIMELENKLNNYNTQLTNVTYIITDLENKRTKLLDEIGNYRYMIEEENRCPVCKQVLHNKEDILSEVKRLEDELKFTEIELNKLYKDKEIIEKEIQEIMNVKLVEIDKQMTDEIREAVSELETKYNQSIQNIDNTIKQLTNKKYELNQKIQNYINSLNKDNLLIDYLSEHGYTIPNQDFIRNIPTMIRNKEQYDTLYNIVVGLNNQYTTIYNMAEEKAATQTEIESQLVEVNKKVEELTSKLTVLQNLTNTRLWTKSYLYKLREVVNYYITDDFSDMTVEFDIDDNDNLTIRVTNLNGEEVSFDDLSQGEKVIAKLIIYNAVKKVISSQIEVKNLFLDEVIDRLDQENIELVLNYLSQNVNNESVCVITHNSYAKNIDIWSNVIELS